ncbi:hypothetical protein SAMN04489747_3116 [Auraticoccus monumenti]|uniref:N-acetyltransferase domain-containing protein n=1 Tax=Auraticoccus monumenti TaxID=675864 RepID=A0A1G7BZK7_9ACTN|nr:hypothetical protein SAMN04489747_3116 [Auraticoccus monumenti]
MLPPTSLVSTGSAGAVRVLHHAAERFYELLEDGVSVGMLIYETSPGHSSITHAMVRADRRGRGLGATLISTALDHLAATGAPVRVHCATVAGFLQRFPEYTDRVQPTGHRGPR